MSKTVDERVVSMQFDNAQFERNVSTSMSTLNKLKQSLKLDDAAKGLDNVSNAASRFNLSGMGEGIETVKAKFSALEVMAVTALANITNSAFNAGKKLVSAFTIEPIKTGFQEYESTRSCASDWWNPQGDINNAVGQNVPIMLDLTNHSVVVSGKVTYTVEYEYTHSTGILWWKKDVTETIIRDEDFAIVCEGWGRVNRSVVWFGEITNWWDGGMQATWATSREV